MKYLEIINRLLEEKGLNYEFERWSSPDIVFPYWVGDYTENFYSSEYGYTEYTFMLTGTTNKNWSDLLQDKEKIKELFKDYTYNEKGYSIAIYYENSLNIPTEDMSIKRMQINLTIKEWR